MVGPPSDYDNQMAVFFIMDIFDHEIFQLAKG